MEKPAEKTSDKASSSGTSKSQGGGLKKSLFGGLNMELRQALDSWDSLAQEVVNKKSPDEERLQEVKRILGELKSKLDQFED